jgi:hypothetical protein
MKKRKFANNFSLLIRRKENEKEKSCKQFFLISKEEANISY